MKEFPRTFKYGRVFRVKLKNNHVSKSFINVTFFEYGLKVLENGKLTVKHLTSINRLLKKLFKKTIFFRFNVSLVTPVTKKPLETRMGKGKAERKYWECQLLNGMVVLEVGNLKLDRLDYGLRLVSERLPVSTKVVKLVY